MNTDRYSSASPQKASAAPATDIDSQCPMVEFDDLQLIFDQQKERLSSSVRTLVPNTQSFLHRRSARLKSLHRDAALALCYGIATAYWGTAMWHRGFDIYCITFSLILEFLFVSLTAFASATVIARLVCSPSRVSLSHLFGRSGKILFAPSADRLWNLAAISVAAYLTLFILALAPGFGDGYVIRQGHQTRVEIINNVTSLLSSL